MDNDLIKRKKLLELYEGLENQGLKVPVEVIIQNIKDMPTVDAVEVVYGEWYGVGNMWMCTECDEQFYDATNYCPNCGAKMDG